MRFLPLLSLCLLIGLLAYGCSPSVTPADPDFTTDALEPFASLHLLPLEGAIERSSDKELSTFEGTLKAYGPTMTLEGTADNRELKVYFFQTQDRVTLTGTWGIYQLVEGMGELENSTLWLRFQTPGFNNNFTAVIKPKP